MGCILPLTQFVDSRREIGKDGRPLCLKASTSKPIAASQAHSKPGFWPKPGNLPSLAFHEAQMTNTAMPSPGIKTS